MLAAPLTQQHAGSHWAPIRSLNRYLSRDRRWRTISLTETGSRNLLPPERFATCSTHADAYGRRAAARQGCASEKARMDDCSGVAASQ